MKTSILIFFILFTISVGYSANVSISNQTVIGLNHVVFSFSGLDLINTGTIFDSNSTIAIGAKEQSNSVLMSAPPLYITNLHINGNTSVDMDSLIISNEIVMNTGVLDIHYTAVTLLAAANLLEKEDSYITGVPGHINKSFQTVENNTYNTGMGLSYVPSLSQSMNIIRTHQVLYNGQSESIPKSYSFIPPVQTGKVDFYYYGQSEELTMYAQDNLGKWHEIDGVQNKTAQRVSAKLDEITPIARLSVFPFPALQFPKMFTPNGDGVNDLLLIPGNKKYANSRISILTPSGKIVYDSSPYKDDFDASNMEQGTYYYIYYSDKSKKPLHKGALEIFKR